MITILDTYTHTQIILSSTFMIYCIYNIIIIIGISISFTLYTTHSRVGKGNLVLRHSVPHFPPSSGGIACCMAELNAALSFDTRAYKWKYKFKQIFHLIE